MKVNCLYYKNRNRKVYLSDEIIDFNNGFFKVLLDLGKYFLIRIVCNHIRNNIVLISNKLENIIKYK